MDYEPDGRRYHLGLRVFQLGQRVSNHHGFAGTALPILRRVTEETGEATILSVRDGIHHLTVNKVDGPQTFRVTSDPGHLGALHTTSVGKALVAFADDATRARLVDELPLDPLTEHSITDREAFRAEIDLVRRRGYATMDEENELGHACRRRSGFQCPGPCLRLPRHGRAGVPPEHGGPRGPRAPSAVGRGRAVRPAAPAVSPQRHNMFVIRTTVQYVNKDCNVIPITRPAADAASVADRRVPLSKELTG